jgi:hypothetical protein
LEPRARPRRNYFFFDFFLVVFLAAFFFAIVLSPPFIAHQCKDAQKHSQCFFAFGEKIVSGPSSVISCQFYAFNGQLMSGN